MNLPKDLPEAFERALEGIADKRYEGRIMKLVMAAVSPLTLDEIRLALTVTPGESTWRPSRLPHDGFQLVSAAETCWNSTKRTTGFDSSTTASSNTFYAQQREPTQVLITSKTRIRRTMLISMRHISESEHL